VKQLTVISGKGGTGKTSLVAALATLARDLVLADCDVDGPDLHLLADPQVCERHSFAGTKQAAIEPERCQACGRCEAVCRFDAISLGGPANPNGAMTYRVDPLACEGCLACVQVCRYEAIRVRDVTSGEWYVSSTRWGPMVHASLRPGRGNSGKLVALVRQRARDMARATNRLLVLIDGPPGMACPVIASITGVDMALIVTEPTVSGLHDMLRVLDLAAQMRVPSAVCVNRYDVNPVMTERIESAAREHDALVTGRLPHSRDVVDAQAMGLSVIEHTRDGASRDVRRLWDRLAMAMCMGEQLKETVQ
jgi:MinD superfamily P-loop ATPase